MPVEKRPVAVLSVAAAILLLPALSGAGSLIRMESKDFRASPAAQSTVEIATDGPLIRMDAVGQSASDAGSMVFRSDAGEMTAIDHSRKRYFVLDEAALQGLAGQVNNAMAEMQAALAELPPEQRAMAEQMMKQRMGSAMNKSATPRELAKTGETETVNGFDCELYNVTESGQKTRDMCVTSWSNIEGGNAFKDNMVAMASFFEHMRDLFSQNGMDLMGSRSEVFTHMREINGFPVRARNYNGAGTVIEETTLVSSEAQSFNATFFQAPEEYTAQRLQR